MDLDVEGKKKNDIRRRLETKAEWATLTEEEKLIILNQATDFYQDVKKAMKY